MRSYYIHIRTHSRIILPTNTNVLTPLVYTFTSKCKWLQYSHKYSQFKHALLERILDVARTNLVMFNNCWWNFSRIGRKCRGILSGGIVVYSLHVKLLNDHLEKRKYAWLEYLFPLNFVLLFPKPNNSPRNLPNFQS